MRTPSRVGGNSYTALRTPSFAPSGTNGGITDAIKFSPFRFVFCIFAHSQHSSRATIQRLFTSRSPLNITHFIMSVYINAVYGILSGRSLSKFSKKLFKGFKAEFDATPTIVGVLCFLRGVTSPSSRQEGGIFSRLRCSVSSLAKNTGLLLETSARTDIAASQIVPFDIFPLTTSALAQPSGGARVASMAQSANKTNNQQTLKLLSAKILCISSGRGVKIDIRHRFFSLIEKFKSRVVWTLKSFQPVPLMIAYSVR